jgi:hypothetical protein
MPAVGMRDLQLRARGAVSGSAGSGVPDHIRGMVSSVRSALKTVHASGAGAGSAKINASLDRYLQNAGSSNPGRRGSATAAQNYVACVDQYEAWAGGSSLSYVGWELRDHLIYAPGDTLDVITRVALKGASGRYWGRLLMWDRQPVSPDAAELIACPVVEALEVRYGAGNVAGVEVWQLRTQQRHSVIAAAAKSRRNDVARLIASM